MTNEQKAQVIAEWDGYYIPRNSSNNLTNEYLTDLNYLVPVAIKVMQKLDIIDYDAEDLRYNILGRLTYLELNNYQPLFDAVFDGIVYLNNQETNEQHRLYGGG